MPQARAGEGFTPSRQISSPQETVDRRLEAIVARHRANPFRRPVPDHSRRLFDSLLAMVAQGGRPLILDAGCGTGTSTRTLAHRYTDHLVLGLDRSAHRLSRGKAQDDWEKAKQALAPNAHFIRMDLMDFYPLAAAAGLTAARHYLFYPNPYPKPAQIARRWHASPVFPDLLRLSPIHELRTNWKIYAEEFAAAARLSGYTAQAEPFKTSDGEGISAFETKYAASGHDLWCVRVVAQACVGASPLTRPATA